MRKVRSLEDLGTSASRRLLRLRLLVESLVPPLKADHDRLVAFVVIEALNLWASFARSFYISCLLRAFRPSGTRVTIRATGIKRSGDAISFAMTQMGRKRPPPWKRRDEPVWRDPQTLIRLFSASGASNLPQVLTAFSYPPAVFGQLPVARNFFAHRNDETAAEVANLARSLLLSTKLRPLEVVCSRLSGRPQNVLADWLDDLRNVIELLCL